MERAAVQSKSRTRTAVSVAASIVLHALVLLVAATHPWASSSEPQAVAVELVALPEPVSEPPPEPEMAPRPPDPLPPPAAIEPKPKARPSPVRKVTQPQPRQSAPVPMDSAPAASDENAQAPAALSEAAPASRPVSQVKGNAHRDDYIARVQKRLVSVKRYPPLARSRKAEGVVILAFSLDRTGNLLSWRIDGKSGDAALDDEAGAMVRRAAPFPPFPETIPSDRMDLVVPISFTLTPGRG